MKRLMGIISALRVGASIKNQTGVKWAGLAVAAALSLLAVAQSFGYLQDVESAGVVELVMALVVLYAQAATTTKVGLLPSDKRAAVDAGADVDAQRLHDMPTDPHASGLHHDSAKRRHGGGVHAGPFLDR